MLAPRPRDAAPPSSDDDEAQLAIAVAAEMARGREENLYIDRTRSLLRLMRHALSCPAARGHANAQVCNVPGCAKVSLQLRHVADCNGDNCRVPGCKMTGDLMRHHLLCWNALPEMRCSLCAPVCAEAESAVKPPMPVAHVPSPQARPRVMPPPIPAESDAPDAFRCPVSGRVMEDCVMLVNSGQSYERKHLLRELEARAGVDPCTQARFEDRPLIAENRTLERAIAHWREHRVKDSGGHGVAKVPTDESGEPVRRQCSTCNKFKTQFQMRGADSASVSELFRTSRSRRWRLHETMSPRRRRRGRQRIYASRACTEAVSGRYRATQATARCSRLAIVVGCGRGATIRRDGSGSRGKLINEKRAATP